MSHGLTESLPQFARELCALLEASLHAELLEQIPSLRIHDRCRCGDDFCSTFYTAPRPKGAYGTGYWALPLRPETGMVILDLVNQQIVCVEVLYRPDVQRELFAVIP